MDQQRIDSPAGSPPDDAGHQGSYTTPLDVLEMHAADRPPAAPALHRDLDRTSGDGANPFAMLLWALLFFAIVAFFMLVR
jgi:hypothetical protein